MQNHGLSALRFLKAVHTGKGDNVTAQGFVEAQRGWPDREVVLARLKAAVPGLSVGNTGLVTAVGADFMAALRPLTVIGRLPVRKLPPRTRLLTSMGTTRATWMTEGRSIPVSAGSFVASDLTLHKVAALTVVSRELLESPTTDAEAALSSDLLTACAAAIDQAFLNDETSAGSPAPINGGAAPIASTGNTVAQLDADMKTATDRFISAGGSLSTAAWVTSERLGSHLGYLRNIDGTAAYPGASGRGGSLQGLPLLVSASSHVPGDSPAMGGDDLTLLDGAAVSYSEGEPTLSITTAGTVELSSAPTGSTSTPAAMSQVMASLFQADAVGLRAVVMTDWALRRVGLAQRIVDITL